MTSGIRNWTDGEELVEGMSDIPLYIVKTSKRLERLRLSSSDHSQNISMLSHMAAL